MLPADGGVGTGRAAAPAGPPPREVAERLVLDPYTPASASPSAPSRRRPRPRRRRARAAFASPATRRGTRRLVRRDADRLALRGEHVRPRPRARSRRRRARVSARAPVREEPRLHQQADRRRRRARRTDGPLRRAAIDRVLPLLGEDGLEPQLGDPLLTARARRWPVEPAPPRNVPVPVRVPGAALRSRQSDPAPAANSASRTGSRASRGDEDDELSVHAGHLRLPRRAAGLVRRALASSSTAPGGCSSGGCSRGSTRTATQRVSQPRCSPTATPTEASATGSSRTSLRRRASHSTSSSRCRG